MLRAQDGPSIHLVTFEQAELSEGLDPHLLGIHQQSLAASGR